MTVPVSRPGVPARGLELAAMLSRLHDRTVHHLSASECKTMSVADLPGPRAGWPP